MSTVDDLSERAWAASPDADDLAALLWKGYTAADCWRDMGPQGGSTLDPEKLSAWLAARGVVVLPADHPLRTGQPSEAMLEAAMDVFRAHPAVWVNRDDEWLEKALRAALAVLKEKT